jgi:hypothetical protein
MIYFKMINKYILYIYLFKLYLSIYIFKLSIYIFKLYIYLFIYLIVHEGAEVKEGLKYTFVLMHIMFLHFKYSYSLHKQTK